MPKHGDSDQSEEKESTCSGEASDDLDLLEHAGAVLCVSELVFGLVQLSTSLNVNSVSV